MILTAKVFLLWADADPFGNMARNFRGKEAQLGTYDVVAGLAFLVCLIVGAVVLSRLLSRQDRLQVCNSPRVLFRELCREHGLKRADRSLLKQLARHYELEHRASLFLQPDCFRPAALRAHLVRRQDEVWALGQRLFGEAYFAGETAAANSAGATVRSG